MFVIVSKKKWKALMDDRDALSHDVAQLHDRVAASEKADSRGHRAMADNVRELKRRIDKIDKELKRRNHGNTLADKI